jgi:hypothetical protein
MKRLMVAIARLHNLYINERLTKQGDNHKIVVFTPRKVRFTAPETMLRESAADFEWEEMEDAFENPWSMNRDRMAKDVEYLQLTCPEI